MLNRAILMGRLVADPELRNTPSGVAVVQFRLAVDRDYTPKGQEKQTDFINIVAWRNTAEFIAKYFEKGQLIALAGSIQTRSYTDNQGNKRSVTEVIANQAYFCGGKNDNKKEKPSFDENDFEEINTDYDLPF
jgi:single-strand DNA-binding protein